MRRLITLISFAIALTLALPASAQEVGFPSVAEVTNRSLDAATLTPKRQRIEFLLSGHHFFPEREDLVQVSPDAHLILIQIARDGAVRRSTRLRAIDALGLFNEDPEVASYFEQLLALGTANSRFLRHSVTSSLKAFGPRAVPWVKPYLDAPDLQMRLDVINSMGKFGGVEGKDLLRTAAPLERNEVAREQIVRALR
jgi:hypothetical protein